MSDFPEDGVEDEDGVPQFRGRAVTEAIVEILKGFGFQVSPPEYDDHGWGFEFRASERRFGGLVTAMDETLLLNCEDLSRSLTDKLFKRPPSPIYVDVMKRLNGALGRDPRFHHLQWYADSNLKPPVSASPVDEHD
ncbi:hypothetical protein [Phenylobacterium sp.]|uniref:hypothetical protein n=1 Tax=Phenylobacterium sp. TaxID=1871053 RepID=UPI0027286091|nr:hypothetical protein [Phenylobacterium sp.]MDO8378655.1 hypothetical protein [Phenylobacterium sp.]